MDPKACLNALLDAIRSNQTGETVQHASDLLMWILAGGEIPETNTLQRNFINDGLARAIDMLDNR